MLSPEARSRLIEADESSDFFLGLLGLDNIPTSPEEFPDDFFLPAGFMGPIRTARVESDLHGYERSGYLKWDAKNKILKHKRMRVISSKFAYSPLILPFQEIPIVTYHTHPKGTSLPSDHDIKIYGNNKRTGRIFITIGENDITALMHASNTPSAHDIQGTELRDAFYIYSEGLNASLAQDHQLVLFRGQDTIQGAHLRRVMPISFEQYQK